MFSLRAGLTARAYVACVTVAGLGVLAGAAARAVSAPFESLMLFAAAAVVAELFHVPSDDESLDPVDAQTFSFSSGVHVATILVLGSAPAALVAGFGVVAVDRLRGQRWRHVLFNAAAFALSAGAAGAAFMLAGGRVGRLDLPHDLLALGALLATYRVVNLGLVSGAIAVSSGVAFRPLFLQELRMEIGASAAEAGLGVAVAFAVFTNPWLLLALAPLAIAVYQAHARLTQLRRETLHALETFANVVDERDAYTFRHSERVAEHVRVLGERLSLPAAEIARLRLAGRLHDLGKIAVDGAILTKPSRLDEEEWAAMRRHPRLSARLLRRFRFAAVEASLVEYHHERFDGGGYYGIGRDRMPLGAHFLVVADSFDAMTSDRSYRASLSRDEALARIEADSGTQFHPLVAKAFVAVQRGEDPAEALTSEQLRELRRISVKPRRQVSVAALARADLAGGLAVAGIIGVLVCVGLGRPLEALLALVVVGMGLGGRAVEHLRTRRLTGGLHRALARPTSRETHFHGLAARIAAGSRLRWAGLVAWSAADLSGTVELESSEGGAAPGQAALVSWLIRETDARGNDLIMSEGAELGSEGVYVALPLRGGADVAAYLTLAFDRVAARHVQQALRACRDDLAAALVPAAAESAEAPRLAAVS